MFLVRGRAHAACRLDEEPMSMAEGPELIRCEDVGKYYPDGNVTALAGVTMRIAAGEFIAIMGPSGSGKSTLINLLGGLDRPSAGTIYFEGKPLKGQNSLDRIRRDKVGFVFQAFHLIPTLTASENVQIPLFERPLSARARRERAEYLLGEMGLAQRLNHLPSQLSGGERQRVAIARALANDPAVILADEPTGNLDTHTGDDILNVFERLHRERQMTLIIVTHSPEVSNRARRVIRVRDGRIIEDTVSAGS
jgi:putative ABC transport system ATP-binding protein